MSHATERRDWLVDFRCLYLIYVRSEGERPDELLYRDPQILGAVALWLLIVALFLYVSALEALTSF